MKNKKLLFILPLLLAGLIFSCQNELPDIWKGKDKEWNATIERAKVIFSEYSPDFPCIQTRGLTDIRKSIVFEPVWDEAFIARHDDGSLTVEAHIRLSKPLVVVPTESFEAYQSTKDVRYLQYLSRAVVLIKENSIPQAFLMTIVGSKDYMEAHDFQLWDVCYKNIPEDFSGMILYHTLSGEFVNGWCVEEGWNFNTCNPISDEDAQLLSRSGSNCYLQTITTYYVDCQDYAGYNYSMYEDDLYIYSWNYSTCGTPYPVMEYYQVCDDTGSSTGSGGGGYVPSDENGISKYFTDVDDGLIRKAELFIDFMKTEDCVTKATLGYIDIIRSQYKPATIKINSTVRTAGFDPKDNIIYFTDINSFNNHNMYEEFIHTIQTVLYTSEERVSGKLNIEFEAKLIIEFLNMIKGGYCETDLNCIQGRDVNGIDIVEWVSTSKVGIMGDVVNYFEYMRLWKDNSMTYGDYAMEPALRPKLLPEILGKIDTNCYN